MKKLLCVLLVGIFITSCSVSKSSYYNKPTSREIRNAMKYSDWRYYYPTKSIIDNQNNQYNVYGNIPKKNN